MLMLMCDAGAGSMMRNIDLVCAFIFQTTLLGETPDWMSSTGDISSSLCCMRDEFSRSCLVGASFALPIYVVPFFFCELK